MIMRFIVAASIYFSLVFVATACEPGGRLTLDSGYPVMWRDAVGSTIWYAPTGKNGDSIPMVGATGISYCQQFTSGPMDNVGLSLSVSGMSGLYDIYASAANGSAVLVPVAWVSGMQALPDVIYNGATVNSVATEACQQYQCTYLGTISVNAGKSTCTFSAGLNREFDVWNYYNQEELVLKITDPAAAYLIGQDGTNDGSNLRSSMGCVNRNCNFSATTLVGRLGNRVTAKMIYDVRGLHSEAWTNTGSVAHVSAIGLDGINSTSDNFPVCDTTGTTNFEVTPTAVFNTGISEIAFCEPTSDQTIGLHRFYLMEVQVGFGQAWIVSSNFMGFVSGKF
jgi:hypothetical protein